MTTCPHCHHDWRDGGVKYVRPIADRHQTPPIFQCQNCKVTADTEQVDKAFGKKCWRLEDVYARRN